MTDVVGAFEADLRPLSRFRSREQRLWLTRAAWRSAMAAAAASAAVVGVLVADMVHQRERGDRAQRALDSTQRMAATVSADLSGLRHSLDRLTTQVSRDTATLQQDAETLRGAGSALQTTQAHVRAQGTQIGAVHTCLSGVQQALNALSVGNQNDALWFVTIVSPSCSAAAASGG